MTSPAHWTRVQEHKMPIWLTDKLDETICVRIQCGFRIHKCACICKRCRLWQKYPAKPGTFLLSMNMKIVGLHVLLAMLILSGAPGQTASPSTSPKPVASAIQKPVASVTPQPVSPIQSPAAEPVVRVKIVVRCDEAAIRTLVENSLRNASAKSKDVEQKIREAWQDFKDKKKDAYARSSPMISRPSRSMAKVPMISGLA